MRELINKKRKYIRGGHLMERCSTFIMGGEDLLKCIVVPLERGYVKVKKKKGYKLTRRGRKYLDLKLHWNEKLANYLAKNASIIISILAFLVAILTLIISKWEFFFPSITS